VGLPDVTERLVIVHPDFEALAQGTAARLLLRLMDCQSLRRPVHLGLAGGPAVNAALAAMNSSPLLSAVDWTGVHIWWVTDLAAPTGDPERYETQARDALLNGLIERGWLAPKHLHPLPADGEGGETPVFDVVLLALNPETPSGNWLSLSQDQVNRARQIWVLAAGREIAERAAGVLAGDADNFGDLVSSAEAQETTLWLLDTAAADAE
jgi:6-phosphogluconolactonase